MLSKCRLPSKIACSIHLIWPVLHTLSLSTKVRSTAIWNWAMLNSYICNVSFLNFDVKLSNTFFLSSCNLSCHLKCKFPQGLCRYPAEAEVTCPSPSLMETFCLWGVFTLRERRFWSLILWCDCPWEVREIQNDCEVLWGFDLFRGWHVGFLGVFYFTVVPIQLCTIINSAFHFVLAICLIFWVLLMWLWSKLWLLPGVET